MEPGHEDREDDGCVATDVPFFLPQWSPVTRTGKTYLGGNSEGIKVKPQWSPVTRTGKTDGIDSGKAKLIGGTVKNNRPPVTNPEAFPHFKMKGGTAYVIKGHVYASEKKPPFNFLVWWDCGKAPKAPAL